MKHTHKNGQSSPLSFSFWRAPLKSQKGVADQIALIGVALIMTGFIARYPFTQSASFTQEHLRQTLEAIEAPLAGDQQPTVQDYLNNTREAIEAAGDPKTTHDQATQIIDRSTTVINNGVKNDPTGINQTAVSAQLPSVAASQQTTAAATKFPLTITNATNSTEDCSVAPYVNIQYVVAPLGKTGTLAPGASVSYSVAPGTYTVTACYAGYSCVTDTVTVPDQAVDVFTW
jgi:hypothetical protein